MDKSYFAVLAIGRDTKGIVAAITGALSERYTCNLETAQMMMLGGHFALALIASCEDPINLPELKERLTTSGKEGSVLHVHISRIEADDFRLAGRPEPSHRVFAVADDEVGLVHGMAQALADKSVNIAYLASQRHDVAPGPLCQVAMDVALPAHMQEEDLRLQLSDVLPDGADLIIESARQRDQKA
jgi:glycine cleavage system regulatory protein